MLLLIYCDNSKVKKYGVYQLNAHSTLFGVNNNIFFTLSKLLFCLLFFIIFIPMFVLLIKLHDKWRVTDVQHDNENQWNRDINAIIMFINECNPEDFKSIVHIKRWLQCKKTICHFSLDIDNDNFIVAQYRNRHSIILELLNILNVYQCNNSRMLKLELFIKQEQVCDNMRMMSNALDNIFNNRELLREVCNNALKQKDYESPLKNPVDDFQLFTSLTKYKNLSEQNLVEFLVDLQLFLTKFSPKYSKVMEIVSRNQHIRNLRNWYAGNGVPILPGSKIYYYNTIIYCTNLITRIQNKFNVQDKQNAIKEALNMYVSIFCMLFVPPDQNDTEERVLDFISNITLKGQNIDFEYKTYMDYIAQFPSAFMSAANSNKYKHQYSIDRNNYDPSIPLIWETLIFGVPENTLPCITEDNESMPNRWKKTHEFMFLSRKMNKIIQKNE